MVRYELLYEDAGDFILDNETGEYLSIEDACSKLNDYEDNMGVVADFMGDIAKKITEAE